MTLCTSLWLCHVAVGGVLEGACVGRESEHGDCMVEAEDRTGSAELAFVPVGGEHQAWIAQNRVHRLVLVVSPDGLQVRSDASQGRDETSWRLALRTIAVGRSGAVP